MTRFLQWSAERPVVALLLCFAFAGLLSPGISRLEIDGSTKSLQVPDRDAENGVDWYERARLDFGDDAVETILLRAPDVFTRDNLSLIETLTWESTGLPNVTRVISLATANQIDGSSGVLNTEPLLAYVPEDAGELEQIRRLALDNEVLVGEVVNAQGQAAAVHLFLEGEATDEEMRQLFAQIDRLIADQQAQVPPTTSIFHTGNRHLGIEMVSAITRDSVRLVPIAGLLVLVVLWLTFRTLSAVVLPMVTGLLSIVATTGFMGLLGIPITPVTAIVPTLLLVIGCTEDIHLLAEFRDGLAGGAGKVPALARMAEHCGAAILTTAATTTLGFLTIVANPIPLLRGFGIAAAFGMAANLLVTALAVPALLRLLPSRGGGSPPSSSGAGDQLSGRRALALRVLRARGPIGVGVVLFMMLGGLGVTRMQVDTDYLEFFRSDSEIVRNFAAAEEALSGVSTFWVVIDTGELGGAKSPAVLREVAALGDDLAQRFDKVIGLSDSLRRLHQEMNDGSEEFWQVPDDPALVSQYLLLLDPDDVSRFLEFEESRTALLVRSSWMSSQRVREETERIEQFVADRLPGVSVQVVGEPLVVARASDAISRSLIANLFWMLVTIYLILSALFFSLKAGLLGMIPNLFPALGVFAAMGWFDIPLSVATFPVAIIALGIAVDDTIHFMVRFSQRGLEASSSREALVQTWCGEFRPVLSTSIALIFGFLTLTASSLRSNAQFGMLAAFAILLALLGDLLIAPWLLSRFPLVRTWDLLRARVPRDVLAHCALFEGLSSSEARRVAVLGVLREHPAETVLMTPDDQDSDVLALLEGSVEVLRAQDEAQIVLGPGAVVGEVAFFSAGRRTATVRAIEPVRVLRIDAASLERLQQRFPAVAAKVYLNLARLLGTRFS